MINILMVDQKFPPIRGKGHPMICTCKQRYFSNPLATSALEEGEWSAG